MSSNRLQKQYYAHSANDQGEFHLLKTHLKEVSTIMQKYSIKDEYKKLFEITGLLHDVGKYQPNFQQYLLNGGKKGSVPHASLGAAMAKEAKIYEAAFAIDGHHKGLPDFADLKDDIADFFEALSPVFEEAKKSFFNDIEIKTKDIIFEPFELSPLERDVLIRYLFSALTDADWLDTEKHFDNIKYEKRNAPEFKVSWFIEQLENEIKNKNKAGFINQLRNKVREDAIKKANGPIGFYSMNLPTGMGKTLASISWALYHAKHHNLNRIIIVLPYISIIDQTAKELKRIFGEEWVLEHHSSFSDEENLESLISEENISVEDYRKRLATENWDYPLIVTTSVQFFESLFSNKPSRCRKVHNIANSVVIFDEVQTLPKELVLPTLSLLRNVRTIMNTSFLFCTATQPAFEKTDQFDGIENIIPLIENPEEIFNSTKRVNYFALNNYKPIDISKLAKKVFEKESSVLCIFNTKKQTLLFFKELKNLASVRIFHLSTGMYPAHRKRVIENIRECLKSNERIIVASTQLIEAGVDIDFPCVFREIAPLESIIQSAGRCNREGKMGKPGEVYMFSLEDSAAPDKQYRALAEFANSLYKGNENLLYNHDFFSEYYRKALNLFIPEDKYQINQNRQSLNFKKVAESYRLIDDITKSVFILCDESRKLYEHIRYKPVLSRNDYRMMQQYSVQVYENFLKQNIDKLGKEPQGYWVWHGEYNDDYGISTDNPLMIL
ncbi:MAG: CRISPR-associated helicase Cas3' [Bacteroidales bacterium]